jgi:signal transduction histidine kinase
MIVATRLSGGEDTRCNPRPSAARRMALIDSQGKIVAVNNDWIALAKQTRAKSSRIGVGADYLDVCRRASNFSLSSHIALTGICQVVNEETPSFSMDYTCETPTGVGYFRMIATQIHYKNARVAICHTDISDLELSRSRECDRVQKFARGLINAQEEERQRISREIHDDLGGQIAFLAFSIRQLITQRARNSNGIDAELTKVVEGLTGLSTALRDLSHSLHPTSLRYVGIAGALKSLGKAFQDNYRIQINVSVPAELPRLTSELELCVFRITQESLQNIVKHSAASRADIRLEPKSNQLRLTVSDSGKGFVRSDAIQNGGVGLLSMQERAMSLGGNVLLTSSPGHGTQIELTLPLQQVLEESVVK